MPVRRSRGRSDISWVRVAGGVSFASSPAALLLLHPPSDAIQAALELAIPLMIVGAWLLGTERISARAVRLLCLLLDRQPRQYLPVGEAIPQKTEGESHLAK